VSVDVTAVAADVQPAERPRDRYRRFLIMEVGSYELALSIYGDLPLTRWKLKVANEMLDLLDELEHREIVAKAKQMTGRGRK
jgi:hypothetical protein